MTTIKSKYDFDDIVQIVSIERHLQCVNGKLAVVTGKGQYEDDPSLYYYVVSLCEDNGELGDAKCCCIDEKDLQPTGQKADPEKFKPVGSIRVRVDPQTGEGKIVPSPEEDDDDDTGGIAPQLLDCSTNRVLK